jgi:acyl-coenzyme A synthetase/AMP-(fatty) acid ligase
MSKLFYKDSIEGINFNYDNLLNDLSRVNSYNKYCKTSSFYDVFKHIIISMILGEQIILLDHDFSNDEIDKLIGDRNLIFNEKPINIIGEISFQQILEKIELNKNSWKIILFTSGTTGLPKKISHTFDSLTRFIKIDRKRKDNVWGFAYNPTHMAGLQVFFQAFLNHNSIVRLFGLDRNVMLDLINKSEVTNISSTPTFYRMLLPSIYVSNKVTNLTSGGEKFDSRTLEDLKVMFPNSQIRNVYASTEAGALFSSKGDDFMIKSEFLHLVKFIKSELFIHSSLLGESDGIKLVNGWYQTGDIIEVINEKPFKFKFLSRKNEMINTGGYKVNPTEVEHSLRQIKEIADAFVFGKKNSLLGNIVSCEIISLDKSLTEKQIRQFLQLKLQEFKIPRIIKFVDKINSTRTGKISRNIK